MRILLCSLGSHGDVHPYLALGRELMLRGHAITFATSAHYRTLVERHGIAFTPIRPEAPLDDRAVMGRIMDARRGPEMVIKEFVMPALRDTYHDLLPPPSQADLLISLAGSPGPTRPAPRLAAAARAGPQGRGGQAGDRAARHALQPRLAPHLFRGRRYAGDADARRAAAAQGARADHDGLARRRPCFRGDGRIARPQAAANRFAVAFSPTALYLKAARVDADLGVGLEFLAGATGALRQPRPLDDVVALQGADGTWPLTDELARALGWDDVEDLKGALGRSKTKFDEIKRSFANLKGPLETLSKGPFSPWAPPRPIFADFGLPLDGSQYTHWWERRQAIAYIFGIHPIFALMSPELSEERLIGLANFGTGLGFTPETLDKVIADIST